MFFFYSLLLSAAFIILTPLFILRREKYAAGFKQRLGNYPEFKHDGRPVIWLHCVSVGETNAARPLVDQMLAAFPAHRLIVSTTTKTGQTLAQDIFKEKADAVFYFPFDWKFSVRRALKHFKPQAVLLMETEIWPRFYKEAKAAGTKIAIVNGRLSDRSVSRYSLVKFFISKVLGYVDLALMQGENDAARLISLGMDQTRTTVTGNIKFDLELNAGEDDLTETLDKRFGFSDGRPLIVAASTHEPEERLILEAYCSVAGGDMRSRPRLLIAPRHPQRFASVADEVRKFRSDPACEWKNYSVVRRSDDGSADDKTADVVILDSIGELRAVYPLAEIVFVGGSVIPHGGQSILEPAAAGKAIITGHFTRNFEAVVKTFLANRALIQLPEKSGDLVVDELYLEFDKLINDHEMRREMGKKAGDVMNVNRGATTKTVKYLGKILQD